MKESSIPSSTTDKWHPRFLRLAREVSTWSKDPRTQTGAVLVDRNKQVLSLGFNGFPRGMQDDEYLYATPEEKYSRIIHCEMNALLFARTPLPLGTALYTWPFLSCDRCAVHMIQAGVRYFHAPRAEGEQADRWEKSLKSTKSYIEQCGCFWYEYEPSLTP